MEFVYVEGEKRQILKGKSSQIVERQKYTNEYRCTQTLTANTPPERRESYAPLPSEEGTT